MTYRTHYYFPVTGSAALFCSRHVSPTFGLSLPSSYHGNLWLLDNCQETCGEAPGLVNLPVLSPRPAPQLVTNQTRLCPATLQQGAKSAVPVNDQHRTQPQLQSVPQTKGYVSDGCTPQPTYIQKPARPSAMALNAFGQLNCLSKSFQPPKPLQTGQFWIQKLPRSWLIPSGFLGITIYHQQLPTPKLFNKK